MLRRSIHRLTITFFVVLLLLFSQLTLANYACPQLAGAAAIVASGMPCEGMDMDQARPPPDPLFLSMLSLRV